jgi:hypothetical protein
MEAPLELVDVRTSFGRVAAMRGVSFSCARLAASTGQGLLFAFCAQIVYREGAGFCGIAYRSAWKP